MSVDIGTDYVAEVEVHRPPDNFFDVKLIRSLAEAYTVLDGDPGCRAILLCSEGKHFCAGADFTGQSGAEALPEEGAASLYREAVRLFRAETPVVAAVQGAAVGGGLGLACSADFRVGAPEARFAANFARLGFHQGFGLTRHPAGHRRPAAGPGAALHGPARPRRGGITASGCATGWRPLADVRAAARDFAGEIAASGPLAIRAIRQTMRGHLADAVAAATDREDTEQIRPARHRGFRRGDPGHGRTATPAVQWTVTDRR